MRKTHFSYTIHPVPSMTDGNKISVTVCGDGGCGKSSITLRLVRSEWTHEYIPLPSHHSSYTT